MWEQLGLAKRGRVVPDAGDYPCDNHCIYRFSILDLTLKGGGIKEIEY